MKSLVDANDSVMQPHRLPDGRSFRRDSFARRRQREPGIREEQIVSALDSREHISNGT